MVTGRPEKMHYDSRDQHPKKNDGEMRGRGKGGGWKYV